MDTTNDSAKLDAVLARTPASQPYSTLLGIYYSALLRGSRVAWYMLKGMMKYGPGGFFHTKDRKERPDVLNDPTLGQHHFIQLKNIKMHYVENGPEDGPLMLFIHGFPEFWYSWRYQLREFSKVYRTVAMDMRGYGESDKPSGMGEYTMGKLVMDIKQLIQALGHDTAILVAHDWGGGVAFAFTLMFPELVDKLIVCNIPHPYAFQKALYASPEQQEKSWYMVFFQLPYMPEMYIKALDYKFLQALVSKTSKEEEGSITGRNKRDIMDEKDLEAFKYCFSTPGGVSNPVNYYRAMMQYKPPPYPRKDIIVPTLMIWGTNDGALSRELAEMSRKYIPDFTLQYIEGASHWVQQEEPEMVNNYMWQWLRRHGGDNGRDKTNIMSNL